MVTETSNLAEDIARKVRRLPLEKQVEVNDFVDFLIERMLRDARRLQSLVSPEPALSQTSTEVPRSQPSVTAATPAPPPSPTVASTSREQVLASLVQSQQVPRFQSTPPALLETELKPTQGRRVPPKGPAGVGEELPEVTVAEMEEAAGELESFWSSWDED
jgi:hypothetical protein